MTNTTRYYDGLPESRYDEVCDYLTERVDHWCQWLELDRWSVNIRFDRAGHIDRRYRESTADGSALSATAADNATDWSRRLIDITFNVRVLADMDDDEIDKTVAHELLHSVVAEMHADPDDERLQTLDFDESHGSPRHHEERVVTWLTRVALKMDRASAKHIYQEVRTAMFGKPTVTQVGDHTVHLWESKDAQPALDTADDFSDVDEVDDWLDRKGIDLSHAQPVVDVEKTIAERRQRIIELFPERHVIIELNDVELYQVRVDGRAYITTSSLDALDTWVAGLEAAAEIRRWAAGHV